MKYIWLFSIFFLSQSIFADLHYPLGEKDFGHYHGPFDPSLKTNYRSGYFEFEDKEYRERFPMDLINQDIYFLKDYYKNYLKLSLKCDDGFYLENRGYIQYLYRLTVLSYLYEYLRKIHISLYQLGELEQECSIDFNQVFNRCEPKSKEMKSFVKRLDNHFIDVIDWGRFSFVPKNISPNDFKKFHGETFVDIILKSGKSYESTLNLKCQQIKSGITNICSEQDKGFGYSSIPSLTQYISDQSIFKVINEQGSGLECMERFRDDLQEQESINENISELLKNSLKEKERLFFYGALKEFDELGVDVITEVKEEPKTIVTKTKEKKISIKKEQVEKKEVKKVVKTKVKEKKKPKKVVIKQSALDMAVTNYLKKKNPSQVDLERAKKEYTFAKKLVKKFNGPLKPYQTLKALKQMRRKDALGSIQTPFSYTFLRYLLDFDLHQGLFNLVTTLGNEFYIIDDIEKRKRPIKVKLENNKSTEYKWKLLVIEATR